MTPSHRTVTPPDEARAVHEAARWYARLRAEPATPALEQAWRDWLAADDAHRSAWGKVERVCGQFGLVPGRLAVSTLAAPGRRTVLRGLVAIAVAGGATLFAWQAPWHVWQSGYRTAAGERREFELADGSQLTLNTRSAADVAYSRQQRLVRLHAGEMLVATRPDVLSPARPFIVETAHGSILALGTRFNVRIEDERTEVTVLEDAVEVGLLHAPALRLRVEAGQRLSFSPRDASPLLPVRPGAASWVDGHLVVLDLPLGDVLAELSRYRTGHLGCDPAVAQLKVSGAFPVDDIDQALAALTDSFPLRIERFTPYWTRVRPRIN
ncbi:MAG: FecR domain-containing protein [Rhodocyclaceae bacterium]